MVDEALTTQLYIRTAAQTASCNAASGGALHTSCYKSGLFSGTHPNWIRIFPGRKDGKGATEAQRLAASTGLKTLSDPAAESAADKQVTNNIDILEKAAAKTRRFTNCNWISNLYKAIYYPFCVDTSEGLQAVKTAAMIMGAVLFIGFPTAVMGMKRISKSDAKSDAGNGAEARQGVKKPAKKKNSKNSAQGPAEPAQESQTGLQSLFVMFDTDGDGFLSREEASAWGLAVKVPCALAAPLFDKPDVRVYHHIRHH